VILSQAQNNGKGGKTAKMGTDGLLTSVPVFREDRDPLLGKP